MLSLQKVLRQHALAMLGFSPSMVLVMVFS
jgi:hypothetical protein